jgi:hypothetical protein
MEVQCNSYSLQVKNYGMETEDLFVPTALPLPTDRQVWDQSYIPERRIKWLSLSSIIELLLAPDLNQQQVCEDNHKVGVIYEGWTKKWVGVVMDLGSWMKWGACTGIFFALMLVMSAILHNEDCHDFADQRTLFLGNLLCAPCTIICLHESPPVLLLWD